MSNWELDLSSLASVRNFVKRFDAADMSLNVLVNNAAMLTAGSFDITEDGFEESFQVP
jgi:NAD(P)-dependent dehydrogenase (short-subunit alcohol dehydrogenase family)